MCAYYEEKEIIDIIQDKFYSQDIWPDTAKQHTFILNKTSDEQTRIIYFKNSL